MNKGKRRFAWNKGRTEEDTLKIKCFIKVWDLCNLLLDDKNALLRKRKKIYKCLLNNKLQVEYAVCQRLSATMIPLLDISSLYLQNKDKKLK